MELFRSTQLFMPSSSETRVQKCLHKLKGTRCWTYIFGLPTGRPLHSYLSLLTKSKHLSRLEISVPCFYPGCKYGESEGCACDFCKKDRWKSLTPTRGNTSHLSQFERQTKEIGTLI